MNRQPTRPGVDTSLPVNATLTSRASRARRITRARLTAGGDLVRCVASPAFSGRVVMIGNQRIALTVVAEVVTNDERARRELDHNPFQLLQLHTRSSLSFLSQAGMAPPAYVR